MKDDYLILVSNLNQISSDIGPALLWWCNINRAYLGILLINNAMFDALIKYINSKRKAIKIREPKTGEIHTIDKFDTPNENNAMLLLTDKLKEKFLRKEDIWKEDFTICRLCKNRLKRLKFECAYQKDYCDPDWKIY